MSTVRCFRMRPTTMHTPIHDISSAIIGAAIDVHRTLGPGLLESAYEQCLAHEFSLRQIPFERQKPLQVDYKGIRLDCSYRLDSLVADLVVVEVKAIEVLLPIHQAQLLSYPSSPPVPEGKYIISRRERAYLRRSSGLASTF